MSIISQVQQYLKDIWTDGYSDSSTRVHTLLDRIKKPDELGDLNYFYLIKVANSQNIALGDDNIAAAQAVATSSLATRLNMQPSIMTGEALLPITQLEASLKGNQFAFGSLIESEVDGIMEEFHNRRALQLYGDGTNNRGQISAITGNVLTLVNPYSTINFLQNMPLNASTNANGSAPQAGSTAVAAVDFSGGTVTVVNAGAITGLAVGQFLFATTEIGQFAMEGLSLLTPPVSPTTGDSFRGTDRSVDPSRLAGSRLTTSQATGPLEQNIMKVLSYIRMVGGTSDFATLNSERAMEVRTRLGAKVRFDGGGGEAAYGFSTFVLDTPQGQVKIFDDPDCPTTGGWVGLEKSHKMPTLNAFVRIDDADGNWAYKKPSNNQIGVRVRSVCNYLQDEPRNFGYVPIS